MAVRKFWLSIGQSNAGPSADYATFISRHPDWNLELITDISQGSYDDKFVMPGSFPGFGTLDIRGVAIAELRHLVFYNPIVTGYRTYPCVGRLQTGGGTHNATTVYVEQRFTAGSGSPILNVVRTKTGVTHAVSAIADSGTGSVLTVVGWTDPEDGEQFTYEVRAAAELAANTADLVLNIKFGALHDGRLTGLRLRCTSGANSGVSKVIQSYTAGTQTVVLDSAFASDVAATDTFVIEPQSGVAFRQFAYWLPYSPFLSAYTTGKANPYPPGFDYPTHWHTPIAYNPNTAPSATSPGSISYHVALGMRLRDYFGATVYVHACDFGGTSLRHREISSGGTSIGWWDGAQHSHWSPGSPNACYARLIEELQVAIAQAAAAGDTLQLVGVSWPQGEGDGGSQTAADTYLTNMRQFKARLRADLQTLGLWAGDAARVPFIHPEISGSDALPNGGIWPFGDTVNVAIRQHCDEDRYAATFDVADLLRKAGDPAHYTGESASKLGQRTFDAWVALSKDSVHSGEIALCNLALSLLGQSSTITALDPPDGSAEALLCAQFYPVARDAVLEARQWAFAMRRRSGVPVTSTSRTWQYGYSVPGDCIKVVAVQDASAVADYTASVPRQYHDDYYLPIGSSRTVPQEFSLERQPDGSRVLWTNQADAVLRYVARVADVAQWPESCRMAVAYHLAALLAGPLTQDLQLQSRMSQMSLLSMAQAAEVDGQQHRARPQHKSPWHSAR